jgi:choline monooxygenase
LDLERDRLFGESWQYVGHTGDLDRAGMALPIEISGLPIILTRSSDDAITALVNVCSHRGSIVCPERTNTESLTCPYHAWRYGLDGTLLTAPRSNREPWFDPTTHGLESLPIGRWGPFLFVGMSSSVEPFDRFIGEIPKLVADAGIDVDLLVFERRSPSAVRANWKVCVENFLECYHCRVAHPGFSKAIDTSIDGYELVSADSSSTQYGPVRPDWTGPFDPTGPIGRSQFHLLYPNTAINIMPGEPNLSIGPINPVAPQETHRFLDYFFGPQVSDDWIASMIEFDDQVGAEDVVLVESVQRGVAARPERTSVLFTDSENLIEHFQAYVSARLSE